MALIRRAFSVNVWREVIRHVSRALLHIRSVSGPTSGWGPEPKVISNDPTINTFSNYYILNSNAARVHYSSVSASFEPDMIAAPPNDGDLCQDAKYLDEMKTKHRYQRPKRQRYKMTDRNTFDNTQDII